MTSESVYPPINSYESHVDRYWAYIFERQRIWHKRFRLGEAPPWTEDSILGAYSFTNAYRELDRGTIYYLEHVLPQLAEMCGGDERYLMGTILYRFFNRVSTWQNALAPALRTAGGRFDWDLIEAMVREWAKSEPVFTNAHMVCAYHQAPGTDKINKVIRFMRTIDAKCDTLLEAMRRAGRPQDAWRELTLCDGLGPFNAYEVYSDCMLIDAGRYLPFKEDDWANAGPGAKNGLRVMLPNRSDWLKMMYELRDTQRFAFVDLRLPFQEVAPRNSDGSVRWLTMRNIEHNLCEYFKYSRGSCRMRFDPLTRKPEKILA